MGRTGKILRSCYAMGGSVKDKWNYYLTLWDSASSVYYMVRKNVVRNKTDIDDRAWSGYNSVNSNITQTFFDFGRLVYLYLLQDLNKQGVQSRPKVH